MGGISVLLFLGIMSFIVMFLLVFMIIVIIYTTVSYILESLSARRIGENLQYRCSSSSWIPFYNKYLIGKMAGSEICGIISGFFSFAAFCLTAYFFYDTDMPVEIFIILLASLFITFISDAVSAHRLYKSAIGDYGIILTVFTVLTLGVLRPMFIFAIKSRVHKIEK